MEADRSSPADGMSGASIGLIRRVISGIIHVLTGCRWRIARLKRNFCASKLAEGLRNQLIAVAASILTIVYHNAARRHVL